MGGFKSGGALIVVLAAMACSAASAAAQQKQAKQPVPPQTPNDDLRLATELGFEYRLNPLGYVSTWAYTRRQAWLLDPENFLRARTTLLNSANIGPKRWLGFLNYMGLKENITPVRLGS